MKTIYHLFHTNNEAEFTNEILNSISEFDNVDRGQCSRFYSQIHNSFDYTGFKPFLKWEKSNYTDLSIYSMDYYKIDTLICFNKLSQKTTERVIQILPKTSKNVLDYGGGLGATTLQLAVNFPNKQIYYFDLQNDFFKFLLKKYKIDLKNLQILNKNELKNKKIDVLMMLEFLEHFKQPIDFLDKTIKDINPIFLIFSYTFRKLGLGHYPSYEYKRKNYYRKVFAKVFNSEIKKRHNFIKQNRNVYLYKI